ncbi:hypothetical protein BLNAU_19150 [Blattamonas nauphoetae]|uniref:Acid phosphatase n=1 Tax=Blattamonas nauphoetae TaxID=2049346 RepID=A0ABQ9X2V8_9EUKA|nr:hypothetical protein BLNAU_19150 [Blattamonas nauphoetae]
MLLSFFSIIRLVLMSELVSVTVISKNGDRGQDVAIPGWTVTSPLQITPLGLQQHVRLGEVLKEKYVDELKFLAPKFSPKNIYSRASVSERTMMSASAQLAGIFPLGAGPNNMFNFPVVSELQHDDYFANAPQLCPSGRKYWEETQKSEEYVQSMAKFDQLLQDASTLLDFDVTLYNLENVYQAMEYQNKYSKLNPEQTTVFNQLAEALHTQELYKYPNDDANWLTVANGLFFYDLFFGNPARDGVLFSTYYNETLNPKQLRLYTMHSSTVFSVLRSLNATVSSRPYSAAAIIIELYAFGDYPRFTDGYLKFYYQPDESSANKGHLWNPFTPRGCVKPTDDPDGCKLEDIQEEFFDHVFSAEEREDYITLVCSRKPSDRYAPAKYRKQTPGRTGLHTTILTIFGLSLFVCIALIVVGCCAMQSRSRKAQSYAILASEPT